MYNSKSSLSYVKQTLESSLLRDLQRENRRDFHDLPVVVVLGHNPDVDERTLAVLREEGQLLADRLVINSIQHLFNGIYRVLKKYAKFCT